MLGLVTAEDAASRDGDLAPLAAVLRTMLGDDCVTVVSWDDPQVDWESFDHVVIRSTWDYTDRLDDFLRWVDLAASATTLLNSADAIRWNVDKRYLDDLAAAGIPVVPTTFVPPAQLPPVVNGLHVVKPTVGASSSGARRCDPDEVAAHVDVLHRRGRTAMVQPYLDLLDERSETSLCFVSVDGTPTFSHAVAKDAILTTGDLVHHSEVSAKENVRSRIPTDEERSLAAAVLTTDVVQGFEEVFFARVDVAPLREPDGGDTPVVMELELVEPSFFFATSDDSLGLFSRNLAERVSTGSVGV